MKRIYISTVGRGKQKEESSKVYCIDTDTNKIIAQVKLPLAMLDLANPRGGCRGSRGLCFKENRLWVAGYDGIFYLDPKDLFVHKGYWFKKCNDIHQIYDLKTSLIEVVDTGHNKIWYFDTDTGFIYPKNDYTNVHPGLSAQDFIPGNNDTLHLNSISKKYGLCAKAAIIFDRDTRKIYLENQEYLRGSHDIWEMPWGEVLINNSRKSRTIGLDPNTWKITRTLYQETKTEGSSELAKRGWTRGMYYLPKKDILFIGSSPAEVIILYDVNTETQPSIRIPITDEICESVFDVIPHPEDWK